MGRSLLDWLRNHVSVGANAAHIEACTLMQPIHPITFALAASQTAAGVRDCRLAYPFGWAENRIQAALKSVPLGQSAGQRILARLSRDIPAAVESALLSGNERQAFSPMPTWCSPNRAETTWPPPSARTAAAGLTPIFFRSNPDPIPPCG
jgi:urease accessory protein